MTCAEVDRRFRAERAELERLFSTGRASAVPSLLPPTALRLPVAEVVALLRGRHGAIIDRALTAECTDRSPANELPAGLCAPVHGNPDTSWIKRARVVGVNVRTVGSFWRVVHYGLTLSGLVDAIHLLPVWEPGVAGSLYGMASWELNPEFLDPELRALYPHLGTPARQLKATVNILHATGRAVGMDVIPHTDRFSQIVLAQPALFEWLRRDATRITDHRANLHEEAESVVYGFLEANGAADGPAADLPACDEFFTPAVTEEARCRLLFGAPQDTEGRNRRRGELISLLNRQGLEPAPATMAPPFRGLEVDPATRSVDARGDVWVDYRLTRPQPMSRVFGPLARYKFYERLDDNRDWQIDFDRPREAAWEYVCSRYDAVQERYGFDFMRGDMSHVQMRPGGVPASVPARYDLLGGVKARIRRRRPSFAYFAETFMAPPGVMGYGDEADHLEASDADVTLGDLQSVAVASDEFQQRLRQYLDSAGTRRFAPCFTLMTGDKDDPRFDSFYLAGNELRLFCALFVTSLPAYVALGFELRDPHPAPAPNECYSKLYVFHESEGPKATRGPYRFGRNAGLFLRLRRIWEQAEVLEEELCGGGLTWLLPPDATAGRKVIAWTIGPAAGFAAEPARPGGEALVFIANCDTVAPVTNVKVPLPTGTPSTVSFLWSTVPDAEVTAAVCGRDGFNVERLGRGEGRIYRVVLPGARP